MDAGVATDEEKEEYYELPTTIKRIRVDLFDDTGEFEQGVDKEIKDIEKDISTMEENNLSALPEYQILKQKLKQKIKDKNLVVNKTKWEIMQLDWLWQQKHLTE